MACGVEMVERKASDLLFPPLYKLKRVFYPPAFKSSSDPRSPRCKNLENQAFRRIIL